MSKRRHNFGTKRFKEKSLFIFHARIALKSLILLFVRLIARGARIRKTHTHTHRQDKYCNPRACAPRVNNAYIPVSKITPGSGSCKLLPECGEKHKGSWLDAKTNRKKTSEASAFCFL